MIAENIRIKYNETQKRQKTAVCVWAEAAVFCNFFCCVILYTGRPVQHFDAGGGYAGICPVSAEIIQKGKDVWSSFKRTTRNMIEKYTGFF